MHPKHPPRSFVESFFAKGLLDQKPYFIDIQKVKDKLDQNESPADWPTEIKTRILADVAKMSWNQYPHPFADDVTALVAGYAQVPADCVLTGPGTNQLITLLLSTLTRAMKGKLVIARPSFPLYESHARGEGVAYETWDLDENLEYSLSKLPHMPTGSILIFASPNNPVGNVLEKKDLSTLCAQHPQSLIIADEAYFEFADESYTSLLEEHSNLLLLRTCSKTLGAAGLRLGYMLAAAPLISELKKMRLPYLLNIFTIAAARVILNPSQVHQFVGERVRETREERERVFAALNELSRKKSFHIKASQANFFLIRWSSQDKCQEVYQTLISSHSILVRNISKGPGLAGCLRISLGNREQNDRLIAAADACF